ncbi:TIGR03016 family PEP-CTERM system-associated outer membrane protein [Geomonas oryzisoli]|uniref:TIGR03016 family PEP-CTERM system-associated outer membrane protein n=1 Tax=Geomonas oryzisoli TaxID=2847992 RepID=A0ABX8J591_9BACT|nr:TIGR03016 family PEP-CTERM system-associated outer membrane protein [Geomonas oryzisoli]QWV91854.1 TIGR03016 family PEP-CTERM system-associated outer membrane protein [Geomonas oryzisoli]
MRNALLGITCLASVAALSTGAPALAADYRFTPSLVVGQEYNDNLFQNARSPVTDYVTRVQPNLALKADGGGFAAALSYGIDYRYFAKGSRSDEFDHRASMTGAFKFLDDFLHLDLSDSYSRVSTDVVRDVVTESLVVNQTLQNNALISPYVTWRLPGDSSLKTGYRYRDTRYWSGLGIDKQEHDGFATWSKEVKEGLVFSTYYSYARVTTSMNNLDLHQVYAGLRYDYRPGTFIYGNLGYDWQRFDNGASMNNPFWDVGAGHDFGVVNAAAGTKVQYAEDPQTIITRTVTHYASLNRSFSRGSAGFNASYSKFDKQQRAAGEVQKKIYLGLNGRYELLPVLAMTMNLSGDRLQGHRGSEYPYHMTGGVGLDYSLGDHVVLGTNYTYITYRNSFGSTLGGVEANRVIVEMRLTR